MNSNDYRIWKLKRIAFYVGETSDSSDDKSVE